MYSKPPPTASVAEVSTAELEVLEQRGAQNVGDGDRRGLQENVLLAATAAAISAPVAPPLDPEDCVALLRFQDEAQLHPQLFHPARHGMHFVRLLRNRLQLGVEVHQRVLQAEILVAVFFQKLSAILEGKAALARRDQREEKLRMLAHPAACLQHIDRQAYQPGASVCSTSRSSSSTRRFETVTPK